MFKSVNQSFFPISTDLNFVPGQIYFRFQFLLSQGYSFPIPLTVGSHLILWLHSSEFPIS